MLAWYSLGPSTVPMAAMVALNCECIEHSSSGPASAAASPALGFGFRFGGRSRGRRGLVPIRVTTVVVRGDEEGGRDPEQEQPSADDEQDITEATVGT